jgi:MYXO-CTERM domain-containing protein
MVNFVASGGSGTGFTWSMIASPSGGTIDGSGVYTAGGTVGVTDAFRVTDSLGNTAQGVVPVTPDGIAPINLPTIVVPPPVADDDCSMAPGTAGSTPASRLLALLAVAALLVRRRRG